MNFFQSVFSDHPDPDPDPSPPESEHQNPQPPSQNPNPSPTIPSITSAWTFGSTLIQTLASKSESVIQTYRRDLEEFSSGIKKETAVIREAAVKAVNDLPASFEAGAGLAQESLESVGQAIDDLGSTVTGIIAQSKDSILAVDYSDNDNDSDININDASVSKLKPYSRLDAQIRAVRSDANTYLKDPEDAAEFNEFKLGFEFDEKVGEIEDVMNEEGGVVREIYSEIVPSRVDESLFWVRYFYKVHRIKLAEEARVRLVKRAIAGEEDEELSWDVDEDEYEENAESSLKVEAKVVEKKREEENEGEVDKVEVKMALEGKTDKDKDSDNDISIVSSQPSPEEDGWDEIEDIGSSDENKDKVVSGGSADRVELRKRLSVAEEEEDLTWDIEDDDDDETVNA